MKLVGQWSYGAIGSKAKLGVHFYGNGDLAEKKPADPT